MWQLHLALILISGRRSKLRIWFILPSRTASHIMMEVMINDNNYSNFCWKLMHETRRGKKNQPKKNQQDNKRFGMVLEYRTKLRKWTCWWRNDGCYVNMCLLFPHSFHCLFKILFFVSLTLLFEYIVWVRCFHFLCSCVNHLVYPLRFFRLWTRYAAGEPSDAIFMNSNSQKRTSLLIICYNVKLTIFCI